MHDWRDFIIRNFTSFEGVGAAITVGLLLFAYVVLTGKERAGLKLPTVLLLTYAVLEIVHRGLIGPMPSRGTVALVSLFILLIALTRVGFLLVVDWFFGHRLKRPVPKIFRDILQGLVYIGTALVLFRTMGVDLGSLLTTSAILTAVIGLSLQESLGNLVAGLAVRAEHPFEVGDWVDIGEGRKNVGQVTEINWRATKLRTNDLVDVVVPNGLIAKSTLVNFSRPSSRTRRMVTFQGPYDVPPNRVKESVLPALRGCPGVAPTPLPKLLVSSFGESGIDYQVLFFLDDFSIRDTIDSDVRTRIWYGLYRAGIQMPFPVRDLRIQPPEAAEASAVADLSLPERHELLSEIPLFASIPERILRQLAEATSVEMYAEGEAVVHEGEPGKDLYVVVTGSATVITHSNVGERITLAGLGRGQIFGELSLLTGVRGATIVASRQTVLLRLGHEEFRRIVAQDPGLGESILTQIVERQEQFGRPESLGLGPEAPSSAVRGALFDRIRRFFATS